jgi:hypothetical protein
VIGQVKPGDNDRKTAHETPEKPHENDLWYRFDETRGTEPRIIVAQVPCQPVL